MKKLLSVVLVLVVVAIVAAFAKLNTCEVVADTLAIQDKPNGDQIIAVHSGDKLIVSGEYQRDPFPGVGVWMEVKTGNVTGWVDQRYCR